MIYIINSHFAALTTLNSNKQQPSLSPKILGSAMNPQQTNQGRPPLFFAILFYAKSGFLLTCPFFTTPTKCSFRSSSTHLPHQCINRSLLHMTKTSQVTLSHCFINSGHPYLKENFLILHHIFPCISTYPS